jgi:hypothetical protein
MYYGNFKNKKDKIIFFISCIVSIPIVIFVFIKLPNRYMYFWGLLIFFIILGLETLYKKIKK